MLKACEANMCRAWRLMCTGWMGPERYALLAGCDFTLLPSRLSFAKMSALTAECTQKCQRWEPCGLVQMEVGLSLTCR